MTKDAEWLLLGSVVSSPEELMGICLREGVSEEWFKIPECRIIWDEMRTRAPAECHMWNLVDIWPAPVEQALEDALSEAFPQFIEGYVSSLRKKWQARLIQRVGMELAEGEHEFEDVSRRLVEIHAAFTESEFRTSVEVANQTIQMVRDVTSGKKKKPGLQSTFDIVNEDWGGYLPGKLYIWGARPSIGKSTVARQEALTLLGAGHAVGVSALEMDEGEIRRLMACHTYRMNEFKLRNGFCTPGEVKRWEDEILRQARLPLYVNDDGGQSADHVRAWAIQMKARHGLDALLVDYLQQMKHDTRQGLREGVGDTSNALRLLAKDLQIPVIAFSQLSRSAEETKRPDLHHLKETGNIEQDGFGVMLIHRDGPKGSTSHEFINAKNRGGVVGTIEEMEMEPHGWTFMERRKVREAR